MKRILFWPVFHLLLKPLIKRNYRLRMLGEVADEWYWADSLSANLGYFVYIEEKQ